MKTNKFIIFFLILNFNMIAQTFIANDANSKIAFVIKNIGLKVSGKFSGLKGNVFFDAKNLSKSEIEVSVNSNSVNTDNNARDKHLRQEDYFDAEKFPLIKFKSNKIENATRLNRYNVEGILTIKGVSKTINFELIAIEKEENLELKCNFEINRKNFKVGGNSLVLSDNVKMNLNIICTK